MTSPPQEYRTRFEYLCAAISEHNSDECLMWPFSVDRDGYGKLPYVEDGKKLKVSAHRIAFKIVNGRWPKPNGLHNCDTPGCSNPRHIFEGTTQDNHDDQVAKGRTIRGTQQSQAKLTETIVLQVRAEYAVGNVSMKALAERHGVSRPTIEYAIRCTRNWRHVGSPVTTSEVRRCRKTHCKNGHLLSEENCYVYGNNRQCKQCTSERGRNKNSKEVAK
jgi:hypothetical protein